MEAPKTILDLVERFDAHRDAYKAPEYNEEQVRCEFINPLFEAIGWDVNNIKGFAEPYKEVVHEDSMRIGGVIRAPDYSFRLGGRRIFFLEAKKPSVNLKDDPAPAYQLRRYAWTAKLPVSILTDFEEFIVYDTRVKPAQGDKASTARVLYIPYTEYARRWDEIVALFSPQAIQTGALDKYVASTGKKRGTAEVDDAFLADIEEWRDLLARNIALRNQGISQRELNFAVQTTIDRIVFLRICEDRAIEPYGALKALLDDSDIYAHLRVLYERADERYNSGLFHFLKERDRIGAPDTLTPRLAIDDKVLKPIIKRLYYPESPYEFSVFPAEILGQVYERFLGSVIRLTPGGQAKVEQKPEVRKAGGVYYTPSYIVDYIVKHTVGKVLESKTPQAVAGMTENWRPSKTACPLAILDPACGSGSFLLGAYQYLLDWHIEYYSKDTAKWSTGKGPRIYQDPRGVWRLVTAERKRILLANIYGVDIDSQAVEVTKLSLLLRVLEGESGETLAKQFAIFHERALPDLANNIKCGNSLIGPDFYQDKLPNAFDEEETYRVNAFDWIAEFPEIIKSGGFDAVIGNPPYIRIQTLKEWTPTEVEFYKQRYRAAAAGNYDIYVVFIEKGLSLLNPSGRLGLICPHKFFNAQYGEGIRRVISEANRLHHVVHFGSQQVFGKATTYTCLLFLCAGDSPSCDFISVADVSEWRKSGFGNRGSIPAKEISSASWSFVVGQSSSLFHRLQQHQTLGHLCDVFVGLQTSADSVFILNCVGRNKDSISLRSEVLGEELALEPNLFHPLVSGTDVNRYGPLPERQYILCPYRITSGHSELIPFDEIRLRHPRTGEYLLRNRQILEGREKNKMRGPQWYGYVYLKNLVRQAKPKICIPRLLDRLYATIDMTGSSYLDNVDVCGIDTNQEHAHLDRRYILGLMCCSLLRWYFPFVSAPFRGGWLSANRQFISQLPIQVPDLSDTRGQARYNKMVSLVQRMLDLHKRLQAANTEHERGVLQRQIGATDAEIDRLVYELYELTDEEIAIVEESAPK